MKASLAKVFLFAVIACADAHPHGSKRASKNCTCVPGSRPAESYHIHVMFMRPDASDANPQDPAANNPNNPGSAMALRNAFIKHFVISECAEGKEVDVQDILCYFAADTTGRQTFPGQPYPAAQPFVTPEFAFFVPVDRWKDAVSWMMLNRGVFDVFVHPNTCGWACAPSDHLQSSFWMGTPWPVKFQLPAAAAAASAAKYCPSPSPIPTVTAPGSQNDGCFSSSLLTFLISVVLVVVIAIAVALVFIANKLRINKFKHASSGEESESSFL